MDDNLDANNDAQFQGIEEMENSDEILDAQERGDDEQFESEFRSPGEAFASDVPAAIPPAATTQDAAAADGDGDGEDNEGLTIEELNATTEAAESEELALINKLGNSKFKSKEEFQAALQKEQVTDQGKEIAQKRELSTYYKSIAESKPENVIYEHERLKAHRNKEDINSPEFDERLREKIEMFRENGTLDLLAEGLATKYEVMAEREGAAVREFDQAITQREADKVQNRKSGLESAATELYSEGEFYGVHLEKQDYVNAFKDASQEKLIDIIKNDPKAAVELQLLFSKKQEIKEQSQKGTYNDGVAATRDKYMGQKPKQKSNVRNNTNAAAGGSDLGALFAQ